MVQINFAQKEIQCKIVYYGPGMSGKTTNLEVVHGKVPEQARGELTSIATTGERTLYFDYMPLDLGQIAGIKTKFQLYTVPGQIYYKSTRRLVLQGVDGIVFVADSAAGKLKENQESMADLEENLKEMGKTLKDVPIVIQYNKRDMPDAMSIADLEREVNIHAFPYVEAVAKTGDGVFPTLKDLSARVLDAVNKGGLSHARPKAAPKPAQVKAPTESAPVAIAAPPSHAHSAPMRVPGAAASARPAAARAGSPSYGGVVHPSGGSSVAVAEPPTASVSVPPARRSSGEHYTPRSMQERVVAVSGLGRRRGGKTFVLLLLAAVVGAAAWFVLHR
jgi:signal recognition particle receptor subunit beta